MHVIKAITFHEILNSHAALTAEFIIEFEDGSVGMAASPQGETISIYEDKNISIAPETIIKKMEEDGLIGKPIDLKTFDAYLERNVALIGRNNAFGLSLAIFKAASEKTSLFELFDRPKADLSPPRICCNILNGGWHAYTNPVLSDFHEYILVAKSNEIKDVIADHKEIQELVKERLKKQRKAVVAGNTVHRFKTADNRECIEFILKIREDLGLSDQYDLMIDASGSDLRTNGGYSLPITDKKLRSSEDFLRYWLDLISQYDLVFLEDPFCETDYDSWHELTTSQQACKIIGDNLYSSNAQRIAEGASKQYTHGVVIKPNQSGTVSAVRQAVETSQGLNQIIITSHRSISTEETFVSALTCMYGVQYIKIGPLLTDYSSVLRLNEIMRLTKGPVAERTIIHTLRHAHTTYNGEKRYAGTIDIALNDRGIRDTQLAAAILRDERYDVVIASTLKRSYETARILVDGTVPIVQTDLCNERNFGIMEGLTWEDVNRLVPPVLMIKVGNDLHTVNPKGGEPFEDVWDRAKRFRQLLFREYYGKNILVVSHGVFLQMFHGVMRGLTCIESLALYPANLELAGFIFDGYHLAEEKIRKLAGDKDAGW